MGPAAKRPTMPLAERVGLGARELLGLLAGDPAALLGAAVVVTRDDVLRHVHEAPGQVARVGGPERGVREALARAVGRDEVLQDGHALLEVGAHGHVDDASGRVGHEAAHAAQLADVALVAAGPGAGHHPHRAAGHAGVGARLHLAGHVVGHLGRGGLPDLHDLRVPLVLGDEAALVLLVDALDLGVRLVQQSRLSGGTGMSLTEMVMPPRVA